VDEAVVVLELEDAAAVDKAVVVLELEETAIVDNAAGSGLFGGVPASG